MKLTQPIGNNIYGPLLVRLTLGSYFILAGLSKMDNPNGFIEQVKSFKQLPEHLAIVYGILLPYVEIFSGALLILGFWTILGGILCSLMLLSFVLAFGIFPNSRPPLFNKDIILLAAALSLLYTGGGALSVDRFRQTGA